jgi:hypothetical protein
VRRRMAIAALLVVLPVCALAQYFPAQVFSERTDLDQFVASWYSKHLSAMGEPTLWKRGTDEATETYRFTWLRTFHPPFVFRLSVFSDRSASLTVKSTDGAGGYEPGRLVLNKTYKLAASDVRGFLSALNELKFWSLPTKETQSGGLDGAQWILEGTKDARYHIIDRWSPDAGPFRELMLSLMRLGRVEVTDVY